MTMDSAQLINSEVSPSASPVYVGDDAPQFAPQQGGYAPQGGYQNQQGYQQMHAMSGGMIPAGKYYVKHEHAFLCFCQSLEVRKSWDEPPLISIKRSFLDRLVKCLCPVCDRKTVSGAAGGKVRNFPHSTQYYGKVRGMVGVDNYHGPFSELMMTKNWAFLSHPSSVDFYVSDTSTGAELLGIHREHAYYAERIGCCGGCSRMCAKLKLHCLTHGVHCCAKKDFSRRAIVRGPRMQGGQPVGAIQAGITSAFCGLCKHTGGVIEAPQLSSMEELVGWVMMWDMSHWYVGEPGNSTWSEMVPLQRIEQMV